jgi:hypothetical protein
MTSVGSINSRLISSVSSEPAHLLAAAATELASRWNSGNYGLSEAEADTDIDCTRDTLPSLARLLDPDAGNRWCRNLYECASDPAFQEDGTISAHAARRAAQAHTAMVKAAREFDGVLDRHDQGLSW